MPALRCNKADRLLEPGRRRIEQQVLGPSGVGLGTVDFMQPANDPGLYGPESIIWRVHGDFTSMLCGGIDLLPDWAIDQLHLDGPALRRVLVPPAVHSLAHVLRWSVRNGSWHRTMRRMGRQPI